MGGRTPEVEEEDRVIPREIYRQHVCQRGSYSQGSAPHCKNLFFFDVVSDEEDGKFEVELVGTQGGTTDFTWAFDEFRVELPFIEMNSSSADFDGVCRLGAGVTEGEHLERCGRVSLALIGTWEAADGSMR